MPNNITTETNNTEKLLQNGTKKHLQLDIPEKPLKENETKPIATASVVVPPDGGWGWVVMISSFLCNVLVDGIVLNAGLALNQIRLEFNVSQAEVSNINKKNTF